MRILTILLAACWVVGSSFAQSTSDVGNLKELQEALQKIRAIKSQSGQFNVCAVDRRADRQIVPPKVPMAGSWAFALQSSPRVSARGTELVELDPALLAVGCERLKDALLFELGAADTWRGRVEIVINSSLPEGDEPFLVATRDREGWVYDLEVPKRAKRDRLLRSLVHVLLLEMANRNATGESAEVPLWLVEGMTAHLRAFHLPTFLVQERVTMLGNRIKLDALDVVRAHFRNEQPLTFEALSWPDSEQANGRSAGIYCDSAQLLVYELLHLKHGRAALRNMIFGLASHQNWQLTFLGAFQPHFKNLLDVEKWWALTGVGFAASPAAQRWSVDETRRKLNNLLDVPVEVRLSANRLPAAAEITLQEVIQKWDKTSETTALERTLGGLQLLRWHCAPELTKTIASYEAVLQNYLHDRDHGSHFFRSRASLKKNACRELDKLDKERELASRQRLAKKN